MKQTLIERLYYSLQRGDTEAFSEVLAPFRERILRLAKQRLGEQEAEDIVQETLSALWEKRRSVQDPDHLLPFLFQILRYKIGNVYLRTRRIREGQAAEEEPGEGCRNPEEADPGRRFEARELQRILQQAIDRCGRENLLWGRVLQLLREERSRKEIQRDLGNISLTALDMRIHRARKRLREILKETYGIEL